MGAQVPVILTSRADDDQARLASCAVAALNAAMGNPRDGRLILTLNAGSSSIKFGLYDTAPDPANTCAARSTVWGPQARLVLDGAARPSPPPTTPPASTRSSRRSPPGSAASRSRASATASSMAAPTSTPRALTPDLIAQRLDALAPAGAAAPAPQPRRRPRRHRGLPRGGAGGLFRHRLSPRPPLGQRHLRAAPPLLRRGRAALRLPRAELRLHHRQARLDHPDIAKGRVIVAHLGNGASLCAIRDGRSVGSTMGFSALDGMPMGTRSGQLDPGVILHFLDRGMSAGDITTLLYKQSGLLGLSGLSHDMRTLLESDMKERARSH
jgi:acetate kinase